MKFKKGISILADNGIALYAIKPVVDKLKKKTDIFVYTSVNKKKTSQFLNISQDNIILLNSISNRYLVIFDFLLKKLLVNSSFSSQYSRINRSGNKLIDLLGDILSKLPKPKHHKVNKIYSKVWKLLNINPLFFTKKIIFITRSSHTYLINNKHHELITIVESWDHPVKSPFFFESKKLYVWNNDLKKDLIKFQGYKKENIKLTYPFKFRYLDELRNKNIEIKNNLIKKELDYIKNNNYILYMCGTSNFSSNNLFKGEKKLIKQIYKVCLKLNKNLYIKPHPHSDGKEFIFFKDQKKVKIGISAINNGYNYIFSDEDNFYKYKLLQKSNCIINVGTSFVLEAAQINKNIIQIKLNNSYGKFNSNNYHIDKYLNNNKEIFDLTKYNIQNLEKKILSSNNYYKNLSNWVIKKKYDESVKDIIDGIGF